MAQKRRWFVAAIILLLLALVVGGTTYLLSDGLLGGAAKEPTGSWSVEESFPGSPVSDFKVTVKNLKKATYYELHVEEVQIGERVTLDGSVRSVPLIFSRPEMMKVWFFDNEDADVPIVIAGCHQSGALIFPGSENAFTDDGNISAGGKDDNSESARTAQGSNGVDSEASQAEGKKSGDGLIDNLKRWLRGAVDRLHPVQNAEKSDKETCDQGESAPAPPAEDNRSGDNLENNPPETGLPPGKLAGSWSVEPDTPPTALFTISVVNIDPEACYELYASDIMVGKRVSVGSSICSISLMFNEPSLLKVKFYDSDETASLLAEAECTDGGELKFIE